MKDQIRQMENKLKEYRDIEETMKGVLVSTQQMVHEHKVNAQKESEIIKKEAKLKAQEILMETQDKLIKFHEEISELKRIKKNFKEEVIRLIESHRRMVEMINAEEG
jgi:cell division initiation protein